MVQTSKILFMSLQTTASLPIVTNDGQSGNKTKNLTDNNHIYCFINLNVCTLSFSEIMAW